MGKDSAALIELGRSFHQMGTYMSLSPLGKIKMKREQIEIEKTTYDMLTLRSCG